MSKKKIVILIIVLIVLLAIVGYWYFVLEPADLEPADCINRSRDDCELDGRCEYKQGGYIIEDLPNYHVGPGCVEKE